MTRVRLLARSRPGPRPTAAGPDDERWMRRAADLAHRCPRSESAFAVGAVIVDAAGRVIAEGHSRDDDPHVHAEESALARAAGDPALATSTLYSTLEPCTARRTRPDATCSHLIIAAGVPRVVIAWREPDVFVTCEGVSVLTRAGIEVVEMPELAGLARRPNAHLLRDR